MYVGAEVRSKYELYVKINVQYMFSVNREWNFRETFIDCHCCVTFTVNILNYNCNHDFWLIPLAGGVCTTIATNSLMWPILL